MGSLSAEIWDQVARHLDMQDLLRLALCSKEMYGIIRPHLSFQRLAVLHGSVWRYRMLPGEVTIVRISDDGKVLAIYEQRSSGSFIHCVNVPETKARTFALPDLLFAELEISFNGNFVAVSGLLGSRYGHMVRPCGEGRVLLLRRFPTERLVAIVLSRWTIVLRSVRISRSENYVCVAGQDTRETRCGLEVYTTDGRLIRAFRRQLTVELNSYVACFTSDDRLIIVDEQGLCSYAGPYFDDSTRNRLCFSSGVHFHRRLFPVPAGNHADLRISRQDELFLMHHHQYGSERWFAVLSAGYTGADGVSYDQRSVEWKTTEELLSSKDNWSSAEQDEYGRPFLIFDSILCTGGGEHNLSLASQHHENVDAVSSGPWFVQVTRRRNSRNGASAAQATGVVSGEFVITVCNVLPIIRRLNPNTESL